MQEEKIEKLSKKAIELIKVLFAENSNLQLPVGVAQEIVEIRNWANKKLEDKNDN